MKRRTTYLYGLSAVFLLAAGPPLRLGAQAAMSQQTAPSPAPPRPSPPAGGAQDSPSLPAETPASPFHITGVVLDAVTESPLSNATISVLPMTTVRKSNRSRRRFRSEADSVTTGPDGRFDLTVPSAGGWELTAVARNYGTQHLDEHNGYSTAVVLTDAAPRYDLEFRLKPASVIEGFVLDEAGEAVRGANVALVYLPPPSPEDQHRSPQNRGQQMTDDRGFYKFSAIASGTYQVRVTAHPWYSTTASAFGFQVDGGDGTPGASPTTSGPDPLDVVYPTVWFPGVTSPTAATPIVLHGGEVQEANFRLLPVPGSHLRVAAAPDISTGERDARTVPPNVFLSRVLPDGSEDPQMNSTRIDGHGNADIAGLAPGTYLVHQQSSTTNFVSLSTIQVGAGSPRTIDLNEAVPAATVTVKVDPAADRDNLQIYFRDLNTGNNLFAQRIQDFGRRSLHHRGQGIGQTQASGPSENPDNPPAPLPDRTISLPAGKYEVFLNGGGDLHLASIDAIGATVIGRTVTIGTSAAKLVIHTSSGFGTVTGVVKFHDQPDPGAMVLLIPATLGDPSGIDLPSRDQSNTDGSFEMSGLLPGGYILVAIDHGWDVNWANPATLRRFLVHGVALDIKPGADLKQTIEAQSP